VSRTVTVFGLELTRFAPPDARFRATVSGGTYLRSLARDVGEALGCGAHLAALTRTAVGPFALAEAVPPEAVTAGDLRPADVLVGGLPRRELSDAERAAVVHGRAVADTGTGKGEAARVALFHAGELVAVADPIEGQLKPCVVVADA
jgi:tRNA pseudouridine55 synthase